MKNSQDTERVVGLHDFKCNLMFIDMSKVFKDNKIVQTSRESTICSL